MTVPHHNVWAREALRVYLENEAIYRAIPNIGHESALSIVGIVNHFPDQEWIDNDEVASWLSRLARGVWTTPSEFVESGPERIPYWGELIGEFHVGDEIVSESGRAGIIAVVDVQPYNDFYNEQRDAIFWNQTSYVPFRLISDNGYGLEGTERYYLPRRGWRRVISYRER